jgi:FKBP-type peptidyl-prolyl cis-trans isomerase 2
MKSKKGNKIKVEYEGRFEDGTVFDSSKTHGKPLEVEVGTGMVIPGFDQALEGMEIDEEKEITIQPEEAYGPYKEEFVRKVPRDKLPEEVKEGMTLVMATPDGQQLPVKLVKLDEKEASLDMNHPLAGKVLIFKLKLIEIVS